MSQMFSPVVLLVGIYRLMTAMHLTNSVIGLILHRITTQMTNTNRYSATRAQGDLFVFMAYSSSFSARRVIIM